MSETKTVEALVSLGDRYLGRVPAFEADRPWWSEIEATTASLDRLLGVQSLVLRLVHADEAETRRGGRVVYHVQVAAEPRPGVLHPAPRPEWAEIVKPHPLRATWAEVDGPRRLIEWAQGILGPVRPAQVKTWNLSCLVRLDDAWAKATSSFCSVDAEVIRQVHRYDETLAPGVLGVDPANRWSLLEHAPGVDCWEPDDETLRDVIGRWVTVQATLDPAELRTPRMLPQEVAGELTGLLDGDAGSQLSPDDLAQARRLVDVLPGLVATLESAGLPNTLVHGDFHTGNWRSDGTTRRIVDWADSHLGHPATDLHRLCGYLPPQQQELARSTWVAAWRSHWPAGDPARALPPIAVLSRLLGAITYQRFLDNIEPDERVYHEGDPAHEIAGAVGTATELGLL
ncbi:aminoglycoside phosphotransferase family protein [Kribbella lupini]|uniref:Aminoglycoside phosphotransferase domain-containing protein n=1 Tax=Kribbella lupini TaxID=291602 RepID=A0ABP4LM39_9ACTN